jgi:uridylate kinase
MKKLFVISIGGSLLVPGEIDATYLKKFKDFILSRVKIEDRFILISGGGRVSRKYTDSLKKVAKVTEENLDWLGIYATRLNANLLRLALGNTAYKEVVMDFEKTITHGKSVTVAGGWKPGRSSDGAAVRLAELYKAHVVINLTNIDYVYDKDPRKYKDAKKIESMSWKELKKIVGGKWIPGANVPFDPTAASLAEKLKLKVIIANGKNLKNLENILNGKEFVGTEIY